MNRERAGIRGGASKRRGALVISLFLLLLFSGCYWLYRIIAAAKY